VYLRTYCDGEETDLEVLAELHIFSTKVYENTPYVRKYCDGKRNRSINMHVPSALEYEE
jgi:hypothetical protein